MAILKFSEQPTPVVFREGIRGTEQESQYGGKEIRHFVNQHRDQKDTIYLPLQAQRQLETINPRNDETVLIWKEKVGRTSEWRLCIAETQTRTQAPAASRPGLQPYAAVMAEPISPERIQPEPGERTHAFYPQQALARPESNTLAGALMCAFDALQEVSAYARAKGVTLSFNEGDVRSLGISAYIEHCKQRADGRRAA